MRFSVERLTGEDSSGPAFTLAAVTRAIEETEQHLLTIHEEKHREVHDRNSQLNHLLNDRQRWWNTHSQATPALSAIKRFAPNIDINFGEDSTASRSNRLYAGESPGYDLSSWCTHACGSVKICNDIVVPPFFS